MIGNASVARCNVAQAEVDPPQIFENPSPNCKPIATKSRQYSQADKDFIRQVVDELIIKRRTHRTLGFTMARSSFGN